jgi:hypothetical protein
MQIFCCRNFCLAYFTPSHQARATPTIAITIVMTVLLTSERCFLFSLYINYTIYDSILSIAPMFFLNQTKNRLFCGGFEIFKLFFVRRLLPCVTEIIFNSLCSNFGCKFVTARRLIIPL